MAAPLLSSQFPPNTVLDSLFSFEGGMNSGENPLLLQKNELAYFSNGTVRGTFANPRPPRNRYTLDLTAASQLQAALLNKTFLFQGYCYYKPDTGLETVMAAISGRLYQFTPNSTTLVATVKDVTGGNPQSAIVTQHWLWQAENYVFWNDGVSLTVFFDGTNTARSIGQTNPNPLQTVAVGAILSTPFQSATITLTAPYIGAIGDTIVLNPGNNAAITGLVTNTAVPGPNDVTVTWNNPGPYGIFATNQLQKTAVPQFPVGRMGAYGRGRVWMVLADGVRFIAGDIVGGPSGTKALNFRDAILNITENSYLTGGGAFRVPGSIGDIRAMIFTAQPDTSLGQGPLEIFTATHVFSCNAPVDRLTWQSLTNPILTETVIANGALGQNSTFQVNSDVYYRAVDGWRSLILARRDFEEWYNTPISREVDRVLALDNQSLLSFGTGCFFDNRPLMGISPISTPNGVYHKGMIVINTDLVSKLKNKLYPCYDGVWPGMNIFGIMIGQFSLVQRCYQFVYNSVLTTLELWELLPDDPNDIGNNPSAIIADNNGQDAIQWWFESASLRFRESNDNRTYKALIDGEIFVDNLVGRVDFEVFWKPDQYPCWTLWHSWSECATKNTSAPTDNTKPQFRPRMGLGTPTITACDPSTNRPLREGYTFQIKVVITGQCEFLGFRCAATIQPEPTFAPKACTAIC